MKYWAIKLNDSQWAVNAGNGLCYAGTIGSEHKAKIKALHMSGNWYQDQIDKVDKELRKLDAFDETDPHGYMA